MDRVMESRLFDRMADYYDRFRPGYPTGVVETILDRTGLTKASRLLEIGAGSGKATEAFAPLGFDILCVEHGGELAKAGERKFADRPNVRFVVSGFEDCVLPENYFDLITSAQAFHWVQQPIGYRKCAVCLKENGTLALYWNMYPIREGNALDGELLEISNRYGGLSDFLTEEGCGRRIAAITAQIEDSGFFCAPEVFRFPWNREYTAEEYYGFALTGSTFAQRSDGEKASARRELQTLAGKYGGRIERPYLCVLYLARKRCIYDR